MNQQGRGNPAAPTLLGSDLKVRSGSLKKRMYCPPHPTPPPTRAPRRASPPPRSAELVWGRKHQQLGRKKLQLPKLADELVENSAVPEFAFSPPLPNLNGCSRAGFAKALSSQSTCHLPSLSNSIMAWWIQVTQCPGLTTSCSGQRMGSS